MANEIININEIINDINTVMVENTSGNITAGAMKNFLIDLANLLKTTRQHLGFIDCLVGGSPTSLDMVDTENIDVGTIISVNINGIKYEYELVGQEGEITEFSPFIIKPDNYFLKYWKRKDVLFGTFDNEDLEGENELLITHNARTLYVQVWIYDGTDEIVHGLQWKPGPDLEMTTTVLMGGEISETHKYILRF